MPSYQVCYLDILEYNSLWNESGRISELEDYFSIFPHFSDEHDRSAINILKNYNKDGWTPLSANPFGMGLNDIECDVKDGKCVKKFTFDRKIDKFKIIVVTSDGMTAVSNVIERKAFDSIVFFDYMSEEATELSIGLAFLILFVCTCLKALIVEGLVLLLFRFDMERDGVPFLAINIFTQAFLSLLLAAVLYSRGRVEAVLAYLLLELIILIAEVYLYAKLPGATFKTEADTVCIDSQYFKHRCGNWVNNLPWGIVENVFAIVKDIWVIHPIRCTNNAKCLQNWVSNILIHLGS